MMARERMIPRRRNLAAIGLTPGWGAGVCEGMEESAEDNKLGVATHMTRVNDEGQAGVYIRTS